MNLYFIFVIVFKIIIFKVMRFFSNILLVIIILTFFNFKCENICQEAIEDLLKNKPLFDGSNPLINSGTGIQDLGDYDACNRTPNSVYLLAKIDASQNGMTISVYLGMCVPEVCGMKENMYIIENIIRQKLPSGQGLAFSLLNIRDVNNKYKNIDAVSIIVITIVIVYLFFATGLAKVIYEVCYINSNNHYNKLSDYNVLTNSNNLKNDKEDFEQIRDSIDNTHMLSPKSKTSDPLISILKPLDEPERHKSSFYKFLCLFDIKKNFNSIFEARATADTELKIFDGFRVISCGMIIICHCLTLVGGLPLRNPFTALEAFKAFGWQFYFNSSFTVDIFFSFSGFFLAYISVKNIDQLRKATPIQLAIGILLRLLRIWPAYIILFLIYWKFAPFVIDAPLAGIQMNQEIDSCYNQWPYMLTLLTNFTYGFIENNSYFCMTWYWYIPNDFQYSIIGTFLLYLYGKKPGMFYAILVVLNLVFIGVEVYILWHYKLGANIVSIAFNTDYGIYYYVRFYTRSGPFWIGLLLGIAYANYKAAVKENKDTKIRRFMTLLKNNKFIAFIIWFIGLFLMLTCLFITYFSFNPDYWGDVSNLLYNLLSRRAFVIGLFMFFTPLMLGHFYSLGGFFGSDFFLPLSKLTFSVYLIHPWLIRFIVYNYSFAFFFDGFTLVLSGFSYIFVAYLFALLITTLFELPFANIRELFKNSRAKALSAKQSKKEVIFDEEKVEKISN